MRYYPAVLDGSQYDLIIRIWNQGKMGKSRSSIPLSPCPGGPDGRQVHTSQEPPSIFRTLPLGIFSGGDWSRQFSIQSGKHDKADVKHHLATDYGDEVDLQIDVAMREKIADPGVHMAIESWIAGWNARG